MLASARESAFRSQPHTATTNATASNRNSRTNQGRASCRLRLVRPEELAELLCIVRSPRRMRASIPTPDARAVPGAKACNLHG